MGTKKRKFKYGLFFSDDVSSQSDWEKINDFSASIDRPKVHKNGVHFDESFAKLGLKMFKPTFYDFDMICGIISASKGKTIYPCEYVTVESHGVCKVFHVRNQIMKVVDVQKDNGKLLTVFVSNVRKATLEQIVKHFERKRKKVGIDGKQIKSALTNKDEECLSKEESKKQKDEELLSFWDQQEKDLKKQADETIKAANTSVLSITGMLPENGMSPDKVLIDSFVYVRENANPSRLQPTKWEPKNGDAVKCKSVTGLIMGIYIGKLKNDILDRHVVEQAITGRLHKVHEVQPAF